MPRSLFRKYDIREPSVYEMVPLDGQIASIFIL